MRSNFRMSSEAFDITRLVLIVIAVVLRLVLMPIYLQAYLNIAYERLEEQKKEAGRITNIDLQKKVVLCSICNRYDNCQILIVVLFLLVVPRFRSGCFNFLLFMRGYATICGTNPDVFILCIDV